MTLLRRPCDCALPNTLRGFDRCPPLIAFTLALAQSIFKGLEWQGMVGADRAQGVLLTTGPHSAALPASLAAFGLLLTCCNPSRHPTIQFTETPEAGPGGAASAASHEASD